MKKNPVMPTEVTPKVGFFDRFAGRSSLVVSKAPFFTFCLLLILVWVPTIAFFNLDTWQLIINTVTTIITFLLVALLQNSQTRSDAATQHKLNAVAKGLAELIEAQPGNESFAATDFDEVAKELRAAVGLEERESTT